ncbi:MAG: hypothetical protein AB7U20_00135 [Planctomycetaceae bacterium]
MRPPSTIHGTIGWPRAACVIVAGIASWWGTFPALVLSQERGPADRSVLRDGTPTQSDDVGSHSEPPQQESAISQTTELPWELRPYRVLVSLAIDGSPALIPPFGRQLEELLRVRLAGVLGPYWRVEFERNEWLLPAGGETLARLKPDEFANRFELRDVDKVMLLSLEQKGRLRLSGCEWDAGLRELGAVLHRDISDRRRAGAVTMELLLDLFRPLARIDRAEDGTAELRARAGELLAPESLPVLFQPDDLLVPYFRYLSRDGVVRNIQLVPWTYLRIDGIARSRMTGAVETAFNAPLAGSRRRVELVALRVRPTYSATRLRLSPRNNPGRPLVGVRVRVYDHLPTEEQPEPRMIELMTDRFGRIEIPAASGGDPLRRLLVHSGGAVLSNVPFVPGIVPDVSMELPDDSPRLQAEGNLAIVQGELIDVVSRRTIMLARALSLARKDDWVQTEALMAEIDRQTSIAGFKSKILAIRVPAVADAQRNRDAAAEKRILAMCRELEELVERYLDRTPVRDVAAEINDLKKFSEKSKPRGPA